MNLFYDDFDRRFLAKIKRQNEAETMIGTDELAELKRKARNFDIIMGASKREIESMWDVMNATGCPVQPLIESLARRQGL